VSKALELALEPAAAGSPAEPVVAAA